MSARYPIIDPTQLPIMQVLETIDTEVIIAERMTRFKELWTQHDPPLGAEYDVEGLEFDPIKINQELNTYFELMIRDRINQAARAVTLAYAIGGDLSGIASRYPGGLPRLPLVDNPRPFETSPGDWESDDRYRHRVWLSPASLSVHGTKEGYEFWALTADATLKDAAATAVEGTPDITITVMASGPDPIPTEEQLLRVRSYILNEGRKGETDVINVRAPVLIPTRYEVDFYAYPGVDETQLELDIEASLRRLVAEQDWIGFDHARSAIDKAAHLPGVHSIQILSPLADVRANRTQLVRVSSVKANYKGRRE
jgi:phage-related baseplate assembly protein